MPVLSNSFRFTNFYHSFIDLFMYRHYYFTFNFSFASLSIHFISLRKKDETKLFYAVVCIQHLIDFSNGDAR